MNSKYMFSKYNQLSFSLLFLLFAIGINSTLHAQDQPNLRDRAGRYMEEYQYAKAADIYVQLSDKPNPYLSDIENLATCYAKMNNFKAAEIWFAKVILDTRSKPENLVNYARILKMNSNFVGAKEVFRRYGIITGDTLLFANEIAGCDSAQVWMANPCNVHLNNQLSVNTDRAEFSVLPLESENSIFFVGEPESNTKMQKYGWTGNSFLKIYQATVCNDSLSNVQLADFNFNQSVYHVGPIASNKLRDVFFITRTYTGTDRKKLKIDGRSFRDCNMELLMLTKVDGDWKESMLFKCNNVKQYSVGHATLSNDEKVLYFISDMPGGYGGTDIWYSELENDGTWGNCVNAGSEINTSGNELFPFCASNGTFYFSSNGLAGMGGLDVFSTHGEKGNWAKPVNLHYPMNSPADDFAYWTNKAGSAGYVSSNRENGKGNDDIYSFNNEKPKVFFTLSGTAYDKRTLSALPDASVVLFDEKNNIVDKQQTKPDGTFNFELNKGADYRVQVTKLSYLSDTATINEKVAGDKSIQVSLYLDPLFVKGKIFRLKNIVYDFDKYNIRIDAEVILNELVQILQENPTLKIELGSHTDSRGNDKYNQNLSQKRAQSVVDYLVGKGIALNRMTARGYGENVLLNICKDGVNCTDEEHQENRRTEFKVLDY